MTVNYTTLLGLAQPVPGTEVGTWGTTINDSLTALIESATAGTTSKDVTATGDWTLTTTGSGAANEQRMAIIRPFGTPGASRNIIAPAQSKIYVVVNASNGAVVFKSSTSTGVTIPAGKTTMIAWNSAASSPDFAEVTPSTISGTLPVANGGTGVTSSTGSGSVVLSTSPTLVTPALGTPSSGTLTNCTFPTLNQNTTGTAGGLSSTLAVANGGTGAVTLTGVLKGNGTGAFTAATAGTDYSAGTSALTTGILKSTASTGALTIAVAADFPTLNQNTTGTATTATNLAGGSAGRVPYQSGAGTTALLAAGTSGQVLTSGGAAAPTWTKHLRGITTTDNVALGTYALISNTTGSYNSAIGTYALTSNTTGTQNLASGAGALYSNSIGNNNSAVGMNALFNNTSGNSNVGIGTDCESSSTTVSNEVNIYNGTVTARFQGSASAWSFVSDIRDKTNIVDLELGITFINKLQPRKFEWNLRHTDIDKGRCASGFIAQEVLSVLEQEDALFTGLVDTNDSEKYMLAQTNLIPILVNAIKELSARVAALEATNG